MMTTLFLSGLVPWLIIMLLLQKQIQKNHFFTSPIFLFVVTGLAAGGILFLPLGGFSLIHWSSSFMSCFSFPFVGLLLIALWERLFSCTLFSPQDWKAAWIFGAISSLVLYPAALGLGPIDSYAWGWGSGKFLIIIASLTLILLITKNRFALLLLLAIAAFDVSLQESTNLWDYLLDPIYAIVALLMSIRCFFSEKQALPRSSLFAR